MRMWEERPSYQKQQALAVGLFIFGLLALYGGQAIINRDRPLLGQVLLFAAALIIACGLLTGTAWLPVKMLAGRPKSESRNKQSNEH